MVDACTQLSLLRQTTDSVLTGLEVNTSNFARITNDMVHLHKDDYVLACFKNKEAAQAGNSSGRVPSIPGSGNWSVVASLPLLLPLPLKAKTMLPRPAGTY